MDLSARLERRRSASSPERVVGAEDSGSLAVLAAACRGVVPATRLLVLSESAGIVLFSADRSGWVWILPGHRHCYVEHTTAADRDLEVPAVSGGWIFSDELLDLLQRTGVDDDAVEGLVEGIDDSVVWTGPAERVSSVR